MDDLYTFASLKTEVEKDFVDPWERAERILCVRLDSMGDVLMTTPAIRALKHSAFQRHITLLTSPVGAKVVPFVPEIDDLIVYQSPWMKATGLRSSPEPEFAMIERLRRADFDAAVIFTVFSQNPLPAAFMMYLAGIPLRLAHSRENPYQLLTHWIQESDPGPEGKLRHEVRRQLDLVAQVGAVAADERLSFLPPEQAFRQARKEALRAGLDLERPWVLVHPGASAPSRRYSVENFARVVQSLACEHELQVVLTGAETEKELAEAITGRVTAPVVDLTGRLSLGAFGALVDLAPVLIANNSGPAHIAAAVGTPVVDLYALTNPQHTPWQVTHRLLFQDVPCKFCFKSICPEGHHHCLALVRPEAVVQAALDLLDKDGERMAGEPAQMPGLAEEA